jgi:hypothetical protein
MIREFAPFRFPIMSAASPVWSNSICMNLISICMLQLIIYRNNSLSWLVHVSEIKISWMVVAILHMSLLIFDIIDFSESHELLFASPIQTYSNFVFICFPLDLKKGLSRYVRLCEISRTTKDNKSYDSR